MQMDRDRRSNGDHCYQLDRRLVMDSSPSPSPSNSSSKYSFFISSSSPLQSSHSSGSSPPSSSSCSPGGGGGGVGGVGFGGGVGYIEHQVSKFDTLAGVAIKYGVEVADIKRMNGLVTDLQMFALKSLQIPLPGRHPPSPIVANGFDNQGGPSSSELTTPNRRHSDLFDSFQSLKLKSSPQRKVSQAMSNLQGYYGLKPNGQKDIASEGCEMAIYGKGVAHYLEDAPFSKSSQSSNPPLGLHRKSKSLAYGLSEKGGEAEGGLSVAENREAECDGWLKKLIRRHQTSEVDLNPRTPELLLKEDSNTASGGFSAAAGKGLALRTKAASRIDSSPVSIGLGDSASADSSGGVRKSSSTPSFQESDNNNTSSSIWPTAVWDLHALSNAAAITRPIFDGLPKPISGRKNKAALD